MVAAEAIMRRGCTATIIRPAGVYGDPEGMLMRRVKAGEEVAPPQPLVIASTVMIYHA